MAGGIPRTYMAGGIPFDNEERFDPISAFYPHFSFRFQFPFRPFSLSVLSPSLYECYRIHFGQISRIRRDSRHHYMVNELYRWRKYTVDDKNMSQVDIELYLSFYTALSLCITAQIFFLWKSSKNFKQVTS